MPRRASTALQTNAPLIPGLLPHVAAEGGLEGIVDKVLHADAASGFSVIEVATGDGKRVIVAGPGDPVSVGDHVSADGALEANPKWGRQFKAKFIRAAIPDTAGGVARYLAKGNIDGVGARAAERLLQHFGDRLPDAVQSSVALVAAGLPERKAAAIAQHFSLRTRFSRLLSLLYAHGLGDVYARKIIDAYGDATMSVVLQDPYRLARDIKGIGFKRADMIALSQNLPKDDPERVKAAIHHQMQQFARNGHCAQSRAILVDECAQMLLQPPALVEAQVDAEMAAGALVEDAVGGRTVIYTKALHDCEIEVAAEIVGRAVSNPLPPNLGQLIDAASTRFGIALHEKQRLAIEQAVENAVVVVTGSPGTGKTAAVRILFEVLRTIDPSIRIKATAPTGRAAKRLAESTGFEASTLHRLLEFSPEKRAFARNADNLLDCDVLLIDEGSMADLWLMRDVLRALPKAARLVIVGDADQLPAVGAGNVLHDVVESGAIPVVRLTHIWRQGAGSAIATAARAINQGAIPALAKPARSSDMWGVWCEDPADAAERIRKVVTDGVRQLGFDPLRDVQVLTPGHDRETGTANLNLVLQDSVNPKRDGEPVLDHKRRQFRLRDRVIQSANNYELEVFNGDIGNVVEIRAARDGDGGEIVVDFDGREVVYERGDLDDLEHAYAITIHKSQGSEFPVVVVAMTMQHYIMLRRNLVYTGVSRARKLCCVVGSPRALAVAVRTDGGGRVTGLAQRIAAQAVAKPWAPPAEPETAPHPVLDDVF